MQVVVSTDLQLPPRIIWYNGTRIILEANTSTLMELLYVGESSLCFAFVFGIKTSA